MLPVRAHFDNLRNCLTALNPRVILSAKTLKKPFLVKKHRVFGFTFFDAPCKDDQSNNGQSYDCRSLDLAQFLHKSFSIPLVMSKFYCFLRLVFRSNGNWRCDGVIAGRTSSLRAAARRLACISRPTVTALDQRSNIFCPFCVNFRAGEGVCDPILPFPRRRGIVIIKDYIVGRRSLLSIGDRMLRSRNAV
jgi:hypothetical protein